MAQTYIEHPFAGACARVAHHRALIAWAFASFLVNLGFSRFSYGVVLPALHAELAGSYGAFGIVNAANLAGYLAGTLLAPLVAAASRRCRIGFAISTLVVGGSLIGSATAGDVITLSIWRALVGIASAIAIATTTVLTFDRVAPEQRGRASSVMWAGLALGLAASGPLTPLVTAHPPLISWRLVWIVMGLTAPIVAFGFLRVTQSTEPRTNAAAAMKARFNVREHGDPRRFLFLNLSYLTFGVSYVTYATFAVALFRAHGIPGSATGFAWALVGFSGMLGAIIAGRLSDSRYANLALTLSFVFGAAGSALAIAPSIGLALGSSVLYGVGVVATPAVITTLIRKRSTVSSYPSNYSAVTSMISLGQFIGPIAAAPLVDRFGLVAAAGFSALVFTAGIVCALLDHRFAEGSVGA